MDMNPQFNVLKYLRNEEETMNIPTNSTLQKLLNISASGGSAADKRKMLESVKTEINGEQTKFQFKDLSRMEKERQEIEGKNRAKAEAINSQNLNDLNMNAHGDTVVVSEAARVEQALRQSSVNSEVTSSDNEVDASAFK